MINQTDDHRRLALEHSSEHPRSLRHPSDWLVCMYVLIVLTCKRKSAHEMMSSTTVQSYKIKMKSSALIKDAHCASCAKFEIWVRDSEASSVCCMDYGTR